VFEDDPYVALRFSGEPLPTMLSIDPDRVVYASSFSKTVCPGIRVGYLVGPVDTIDAIAKLATNTYISPNMVAQSIVYEFCASGAIERSIETVRTALSERAAALGNALRRELPEAEFVVPEGGYFMWVTLPPGADVHALHGAAADRGVAFVKGTDFLLEGRHFRRDWSSGRDVGHKAAARSLADIAAMGAVVPEALAAAERLSELGVPADVVCVTSPGLLFEAVQARRGLADSPDWILDAILPADRAAPMVTVLDGHPHTLAFLAGVRRVPATHLGVTKFGQSGDLEDVYRYHHIDTGSIIGAALDLVD